LNVSAQLQQSQQLSRRDSRCDSATAVQLDVTVKRDLYRESRRIILLEGILFSTTAEFLREYDEHTTAVIEARA